MEGIRRLAVVVVALLSIRSDGGCFSPASPETPVEEGIVVGPAISRTEPTSPSSATNIRVFGTAPTGSTVSIFTDPGCHSLAVASGSAADFENLGIAVVVPRNFTTQLFARAAAASGIESPCSAQGFAFVNDSGSPLAPQISSSEPLSPSRSTTIRILGSAEEGSTVRLYTSADCSSDVAALGAAAQFASPGISIEVTPNASTRIFARATDAAGNVSACSSNGLLFVADSVAPTAPYGLNLSSNGPANNNKVRVTGTAESGTVVQIFGNAACSGSPLAEASAEVFGGLGPEVPVADDTATTFYARAIDAAGNASSCSETGVTYIEDSLAPAPPVLGGFSVASPGNQNSFRVTGSAETGSTIRLFADAPCTGIPVATGAADSLATPGLNVAVADNSTTTFYADATDVAGNVSGCSIGLAYVEDSAAPPAPEFARVEPEGPANSGAPRVFGSAEIGSSVEIFANNACSGSPATTGPALAFETTGFAIPVARNEATTFSARTKDAAGNASECATSSFSFVEDSRAPDRPTGLATVPGPIANQNTIRVKGNAETGSTVRLYASDDCSGALVATKPAAEFASPGFDVGVADNTTTAFSVTATDSVGNVSPCSDAAKFIEDSAPPAFAGPTGATPDPASRDVTVSWVPASDLNSRTIFYSICATRWEGSCGVWMNQTDGTSFTFRNLDEGARYFFHVRSCDAYGNCESNNVSVTLRLPTAGGFVEVAAGESHSCARRANGTVFCWGNGGDGRLGVGTTSTHEPKRVPGISTAIAIAAGGQHTCALLANGTAKCWGANGSGQLGDGTQVPPSAPVTVANLTGAIAITAGRTHTCALTGARDVKCWGANGLGQLGDGSTTIPSSTPTTVAGGVADVAQVVAGGDHTCARLASGGFKCWGANGSGQLGDNSTTNRPTPVSPSLSLPVTRFTLGGDHTCVSPANGFLRCTGKNDFLQTGVGPVATYQTFSDVAWNAGGRFTHLAAGARHTCGIERTENRVTCWGDNANGQFGSGSFAGGASASSFHPQRGILDRVRSLSAGGSHTCAVLADGTIRCWGKNDFGQIGIQTVGNFPDPMEFQSQPPPGTNAAVNIAAGTGTTCARLASGEMVCWGANNAGQLGDGTTTARATPTRVIGAAESPLDFALGDQRSCARMTDNSVSCWGNVAGSNVLSPRSFLDLTEIASVSFRFDQGCALGVGRVVSCWGANDVGQLGDGTTTPHANPAPTLGSPALAVVTGRKHSCALRTDGQIECWGSNERARMGTGTNPAPQSNPVIVPNVSNVVQLAAGDDHTCVIRGDGKVVCWGFTGSGQVFGQIHWVGTDWGMGPTLQQRSAGAPLGTARQLALGTGHSCALLTDGSVWCWGITDPGKVAVPGADYSFYHPIPGISDAVDIAASDYRACALIADGTLKCWGNGSDTPLAVARFP